MESSGLDKVTRKSSQEPFAVPPTIVTANGLLVKVRIFLDKIKMCVTTTYVWIILMIEHERSERISDWCTS